ncbi:MAG: AraC family transcriptional regulator, partial [Achromobacter spanius]
MPTRVSSQLAQPSASPRAGWRRLALPADLGDCHADRMELDDGLTLVHSQYTPTRDLIEENAAGHGMRTLVITLAMQGVSAYQGADGAALDFRGGTTTVTAFQRARGERRYVGGATVSQLRLLVGEQVLRRYAGDERAESLLGAGGLRRLAQGRTAPDLAAAAVELASGQDPLDAHIRALTLLSRQLRGLVSSPVPGRLSQAVIARLEAVRALMLEQMDRDLTVPYLC